MEMRIRVVDYKGTKIVVQDFSKLEKNEVPTLLENSKQFMMNHPKGSVLVATNLGGLEFDKEVMAQFVKTLETNKPFVRGSVFFGVDHHQKEALENASKMAQRHFVFVSTEEQAYEHLIYN